MNAFWTSVVSSPWCLTSLLLLTGWVFANQSVLAFRRGLSSARDLAHRATPQNPWVFFRRGFRQGQMRRIVVWGALTVCAGVAAHLGAQAGSPWKMRIHRSLEWIAFVLALMGLFASACYVFAPRCSTPWTLAALASATAVFAYLVLFIWVAVTFPKPWHWVSFLPDPPKPGATPPVSSIWNLQFWRPLLPFYTLVLAIMALVGTRSWVRAQGERWFRFESDETASRQGFLFRMNRKAWVGGALLLGVVCIPAVRGAYHTVKQHRAAKWASGMGEMVNFDLNHMKNARVPTPAWFRKSIGDAWFHNVQALAFETKGIVEDDLDRLAGFRHAKELILHDLKITEAGGKSLARLRYLSSLWLEDSTISEGGLSELQRLPCLKRLTLARTPVTKAGLRAIANLQSLEELNLEDTQLTDEGLQALGGSPNLCKLSLYGEPVTDAALDALLELPNLKEFSFMNAQITPEGQEDFERKLRSLGRNIEISEMYKHNNYLSYVMVICYK